MAKQENPTRAELNSSALKVLLDRVHLKGVNEECALSIKNKVGTVRAIDMSNSIFLSCREPLGSVEDIEIGLGKLSILTKYLEGGGDVVWNVSDKWLTLKRPGRGEIKTLLIEEGRVSTALQSDERNPEKRMLDLTPIEIPVNEMDVTNLLEYLALINCASTVFTVSTKGQVSVGSNKTAEQQFSMRLGRVMDAATLPEEDLSVEVYSQYLIAVLKNLVWGNETPALLLGKDAPLIISQNDNNIWALTPIAST